VSESYALTSPQTRNGIIILLTPERDEKSLLETSKKGVISLGSKSVGGL
jgi:hypothetical protein